MTGVQTCALPICSIRLKIQEKEAKVQWTVYHRLQINISVVWQMKVPVKKRPLPQIDSPGNNKYERLNRRRQIPDREKIYICRYIELRYHI